MIKEVYFVRHSKPLKVNNDKNIDSLQIQNEKQPLSIEGENIAREKLNIEELKGNIIFSDVSFAYDKTVILNNISFEIKSGEKTALVGKTRKWKVNYY